MGGAVGRAAGVVRMMAGVCWELGSMGAWGSVAPWPKAEEHRRPS